MRVRILTVLVAVAGLLAVTQNAQAIVNGVPDGGEHPYVGQLLFYDPTAVDPRFDDPGGWFNCTGTLVDENTVVTAGHCTYGIGEDGEINLDGSGGTDVWISFAEAPDYSILPSSAGFAPDRNQERYEAFAAALDGSPQWIEATAYPHPEYDDAAFYVHDLGVLQLDTAQVALPAYPRVAGLGELDRLYTGNRQQTYEAVGYGLEGSGPKSSFGGDTRRKADLRLVNLNGVGGNGGGTSAKFSSNRNTGGTCFGDSGGPYLSADLAIVAVVSYGTNSNCAGTSGGYRIDQADDLDFLESQGVVVPE
ncbi:trypsin-like serine protease [Geodermatophilus sp. SYSU D00691]